MSTNSKRTTRSPLEEGIGKPEEEEEQADNLLLNKKDIWVGGILPYLGLGHYVFVAGVCRSLRDLYKQYGSTISTKTKTKTTATANANGGNKDELPLMVKHGRFGKIPATTSDTFYGAAFSSVSCAKYWMEVTSSEEERRPANLVCKIAARDGNLLVLQWAQKNGFPWHEQSCPLAAEHGHMEALRFCHTNGALWYDTCAKAAGNGHLKVLMYAREQGCPWHASTCYKASENGYIDVLRWAHQNGCPWDEYTCANAARQTV